MKRKKGVRSISAVSKSIRQKRGKVSASKRRLPPQKPPKKSTTSKLSKSLKAYWAKIKALATANKIDTRSARNLYATTEKISSTRFQRLVFKRNRVPRELRGLEDWEKYAKPSTRRNEKNMQIVYFDRVRNQALSGVTALRFRRELQNERVALQIMSIPKSGQRSFLKFWDKRSLERGYLTPATARKVAAKVLKARFGNKRFFNSVRRTLGGSP